MFAFKRIAVIASLLLLSAMPVAAGMTQEYQLAFPKGSKVGDYTLEVRLVSSATRRKRIANYSINIMLSDQPVSQVNAP